MHVQASPPLPPLLACTSARITPFDSTRPRPSARPRRVPPPRPPSRALSRPPQAPLFSWRATRSASATSCCRAASPFPSTPRPNRELRRSAGRARVSVPVCGGGGWGGGGARARVQAGGVASSRGTRPPCVCVYHGPPLCPRKAQHPRRHALWGTQSHTPAGNGGRGGEDRLAVQATPRTPLYLHSTPISTPGRTPGTHFGTLSTLAGGEKRRPFTAVASELCEFLIISRVGYNRILRQALRVRVNRDGRPAGWHECMHACMHAQAPCAPTECMQARVHACTQHTHPHTHTHACTWFGAVRVF
jgi:hypothetical protein